MNLSSFKLEEYLSIHEFTAPYLLCCSDAESFAMKSILDLASTEDRKLWEHLRLQYTEPYGMPQLRQQIATSLYPTLQTENILCSAGAEEAIFASLFTLCEPEDHAIVLTPCYQSLMEIPKLKGTKVTSVPLRESNQWQIDINEIKQALQSNTKCIVINFPHNPTGQVITPKELDDLIGLCDMYGLWLFSDEVYRLLGTPQDEWAKPAAEIYPKAISLGVMSKAFGMPGLRVGWIASQDQILLHKIKKMKDYLSICNSAPSEVISLITLKHKETILDRNNKIVAENLKRLDAFISEYHELFEWTRPQGGCVGFIKYKSKISVDEFCKKLINQKGVLLLPGSVYDDPNNYFRIGYGRQNMSVALSMLVDFVNEGYAT
ncbi:MAG: aminotransferase class I/II-fold pyridoxal phosphate-dependent enzyme [Gammaproteobacteria bacterium]